MELNKEILKGHLEVLILFFIHRKEMYGYELAKSIRDKSNHQFELKEGTLYLSLKRLEKNRWIEAYWGDEQGPGGRRKYYRLTGTGRKVLQEKLEEWRFLKKMIDLLLEGGDDA